MAKSQGRQHNLDSHSFAFTFLLPKHSLSLRIMDRWQFYIFIAVDRGFLQ